MSNSHGNQLSPTVDTNWRNKAIVVGAILGAAAGIASAYLLARTADEKRGGPPKVSTGDAMKVLLGVIGVVRGIAALGDD